MSMQVKAKIMDRDENLLTDVQIAVEYLINIRLYTKYRYHVHYFNMLFQF